MLVFYTRNHQYHAPQYEIFNGELIPHSEVPDRVENILRKLRHSSHNLQGVSEVTDQTELWAVLTAIHDEKYLNWLKSVRPTETIYPSVFNSTRHIFRHGNQSIQWGNFVTDLFTPVLPATWQAALIMTQASYLAAQQIIAGERAVAVVGRPPGHHAGQSRVGGYCYLNNAALVAQVLAQLGRVAILDVDYHHGNGTQDIFYRRNDVVTCSIHADPERKFPYFAGLATEKGMGTGNGYNRNFPLPSGITNDQYQIVLQEALRWLRNLNPSFLVVSLGLDTHQSDPIADFKLTTAYYQRMARTISQLNLPTLIVLEGGYSTGTIGENMLSFLSGINPLSL